MFRTLFPQYAIRFSAIQELISLSTTNVTLDALIGRLSTFELSSYDNSMPKIEASFKSSLTLAPSRKGKEISKKSSVCYSNDYESILSEEREQK